VLSDPEKRSAYDKFGKAGLDEGFLDPKEIFRMMFGGGKFDTIFGEVGIFEVLQSAVAADTNNATPSTDEMKEKMKQNQEKRREQLTKQLLIKIEPYVQGNVSEFLRMVREQAMEMADAPGGCELLQVIGYIYTQEAEQHLKSFLGIPAFFSEMAERGHLLKETFSTIRSAVKAQQAQQRIEAGSTKIEDQALLMMEGLKAIWKIGKLDIEMTVRAVCEDVLGDRVSETLSNKALLGTNVSKSVRNSRANAVKAMGEMFTQIGKQQAIIQSQSSSST